MGRVISAVTVSIMALVTISQPVAAQSVDRREFTVQVKVFEFLFENYMSRHRKGDIKAFCIVTGRRSNVALDHRTRDHDEWDPVGPFLRRFANYRPAVLAISECAWDGDGSEMTVAFEKPAVALAVSSVSWTTPKSGQVHIRIQEDWRARYGLSCLVLQVGAEWEVRDCVDRSPHASFLGPGRIGS